MRIAYARVSTEDQTLDLQIDALKMDGCESIYQEHASGKSAARPELESCLKALRSGDSLVVWRLDRLGRNLGDLVRIVNELEGMGVGFVSLTEQINTASPSGKLVFHLFASLAEFERNLIRERTHAGLKLARARGRIGGRPAKLKGQDLALLTPPAVAAPFPAAPPAAPRLPPSPTGQLSKISFAAKYFDRCM